MTAQETNKWLDEAIPLHSALTKTAENIIEGLLRANSIDFLTIHSRTKKREDIELKIRRKDYKNPKKQLTDISGIRVIFYFESQLRQACDLIEKSFNIDQENSSDKDAAKSIDQIGYRSVHYVADLGTERTKLPEHQTLKGLKFELQFRTVLQHAWAELAHDRNYKFAEKLPRKIERELFLYAGMLEIADIGFDKLAAQIDAYVEEVRSKTNSGDFNIELNSVSLREFIKAWANEADVEINLGNQDIDQLVGELQRFGVDDLEDLQKIIPIDYAKSAKQFSYSTTGFGLMRDWMIMHDFERYREHAWDGWKEIGGEIERRVYSATVGEEFTGILFDFFGESDELEDHENYDVDA